MAKNLMIDCATCDARKALPENYKQYEKITINTAAFVTNSSGKAFLNTLPITLNCSSMIEVEDDVDLRTINGHGEIKSGDTFSDKRFVMQVNGSLTIEANTEQYLQQCVAILVNGSVLYPQSMAGFLGKMQVNGSSNCYPDGAIVLKRCAVIDHLFALRAKNSLYWSAKRMVMVDPQLKPQQLKKKGCSFSAKEVIIAQSKVEEMLELIDEKAEIIIVPDGTAVVADDLTLEQKALRKYGKKLYVIGDINVPAEGDCLDSLDFVMAVGDAKVPQEREEKLMEVLKSIGGEVKIAAPKGAVIDNQPQVVLSKWLLEQYPRGLEVNDCAVVKISEDISKEMIAAQLRIEGCAVVECSKEQQAAVALVCHDVARIEAKQPQDGEADPKQGENPSFGRGDTKVINAVDYLL